MYRAIFALHLALAPAGSDADAGDFAGSLAQVDEASLAAANSVDPEVVAALAEALAAMDAYELELAADASARKDLLMARLNLARGYVKAGDRAAAEQLLDRVIRESLGASVPVGRFGPEMVQLYQAREAALEAAGKATLELRCHVACEVVLAAQPVEPIEHELYLGTHALRIRSPDGSVEPLARAVELDEAGEIVVVEFGPQPEPAPGSSPEPTPAPVLDPEPEPDLDLEPTPVLIAPASSRRLLPRWLEITGAVVGTGIVGVGGVVLGNDGSCTERGLELEACPKLWDSTTAGGVTVGVGGALMLTSVILLIVDESRARPRAAAGRARLELGGALRF